MAEAERQRDEDIASDAFPTQTFLRPSLLHLSSQGKHFFLNLYVNKRDSNDPPFLINIIIVITQIAHICMLQYFSKRGGKLDRKYEITSFTFLKTDESSILNSLEVASNKTHFILCLIALILGNIALLCITLFSASRIQILRDEQLLLLFNLTIFSQTVFLVYYLFLIIWLQNLQNTNHSWIIYDLVSLGLYYYALRQSIIRYYFQDWFLFILIFGSLLFTFGKTDYFYYTLAELGVLVLTVVIPALAKNQIPTATPQNQIQNKLRSIISDGPMSPEELCYTRQQIGLGINTQRSSKIEHQSKEKNKHSFKQDIIDENLLQIYTPHPPFQNNGILNSAQQNSQQSHQKYQSMNISCSAEASNNCLSIPSRSKYVTDLETKLETYNQQTDGKEVIKSNSPLIMEHLSEAAERHNSAYQEAVKTQEKGLQLQSARQRYNSTGNNLKSPFKELQQQFYFPQTTTATTSTTLNNPSNTNTNIHFHHHHHEQSIAIFQDCNVHFKVDEHDKKNEQILSKEPKAHNEGETYRKKKSLDEVLLSPTPSMKINRKTMARNNSQKSEDFSSIKVHGDLLDMIEEEDVFPWISLDEDCSIIGFAGNPLDFLISLEGNKQQQQPQQQQQRFQNRQQTAKFEQIKRTTSTIKEWHEKRERKPSEQPEKDLGSDENVQYIQKQIQYPISKDHARLSNADSLSSQEKKPNPSANFIQELYRLVDSTYVSLFEFYETSKKNELIHMFLKHDLQSMQLNSLKQKNTFHPIVVPSVGNLQENKQFITSPANTNIINSSSNNNNNNKDSQEDSQIQLSSRAAIQQSIKGSSAISLFGSPALQSFHKVAMTVLSSNPLFTLNMSQNSFSIIRPEDQIPSNQQQQPSEPPPLSLVKKIPSSIHTLAPIQSCAKLENSLKANNNPSPKNTIHTLISIPSDLAEQQQQQKEQETSAKNRQAGHQQTQLIMNTPPILPQRRATQISLSKIGSIQPITLTNLNRIQLCNNAAASQVINSSAINYYNNNNSNSIPQVSMSSLRIDSNQGRIQEEFVNNIFQFEKACNQNNLRVLISIILELEKENLTEQVIYRVLKCRNYPLVPKCAACQNSGGSGLHANSPNSKPPINRYLNHNQLNRKQSDQVSAQHVFWNMDNIAIDIVINPRNRNTQSYGKTTNQLSPRKEKVRVLFRRDFTANFFETIHTMHSSQEEQNRNKAEVLLVKKIFIDSFQSVSHEFGTALNCINNLSDAACNQLTEQSVETIIKPIRYNSTLIQFLVNDILDHHMILQNTFILDDQPFSLSELKKELVQLFYLQVEYKHLDLEIRINSHIPDVICADRNRIQSILMTMIRNAIKYTQSGGIIVEFKQKLSSVTISSMNQFILQLEVSDTGVGLDEYESTRLRQLLNSGFCNEPISKNSLGNGVGGLCVSNLIAIRLSGRANRGIHFAKNPYCISQGTVFTFQVQCTQTPVHRKSILPSTKSRTNTVFLPFDSCHQVTFDGAALNDWENTSGLDLSPGLAKQQAKVNHVYPSLTIHSMKKIAKDQARAGEIRIQIDQIHRDIDEKAGIAAQDQHKSKSRDNLRISIPEQKKQSPFEKKERSFSLREQVQSNPWQDHQLNPLEELNEPDEDDQDGDNLYSQSQIQTQLQQHTIMQQLMFEKQINLVNKTIGSEHQAMGASLPIQLSNNQQHWQTHIAAQSVFIPYSSSITPSSQQGSNILPSQPLSSQRQQQQLQQQLYQQQSIIAGLAKSQRLENIQDEDFQVENLMTNLNFFREQGLRDSKELDNSVAINKNNPTLNSPQIQALSTTLSPLWNFGGSKKSQFNKPRTSKNRFTFDSYSFQQLHQQEQQQQAHNVIRPHSYTVYLPSAVNESSRLDKSTLDSAAANKEKNKKIANILKMADDAKPTPDVVDSNQPQISESILTLESGEKHHKKLIKPESSHHLHSLRPNSLLDTNLGNLESPSVSPNFNLYGYGSSLGPQKFVDAFQFTLKEKDQPVVEIIHSPHRKLSNKSFMNRHSRVTFGGGNFSNIDDEPLKLDRPLSKSLESMHTTELSNEQALVSDNQIALGNEGGGMILKGIQPHEAARHHMDIQNSKQESSKFESTKPDTSKMESNKIETPKQGELSKNIDSPLARLIGSKKTSLPNKSPNQEQQVSNLDNQLPDNVVDKNTSQKPGTVKNVSNFLDGQTQVSTDNANHQNPKTYLETSIPDEHRNDDPKFQGFSSIPQLEKQSTSSGLSSQCCVKILCVDDEPFNHFVMKAILAPRKLIFDTALNGKEAVTMFQQRKKCLQCGLSSYCLIFMDLNMPVKNGFEATSEIKDFIKLHQTTNATIITCSAFIDMPSKSKAIQCGSDFFLQKPINSKHLFDFIDAHFEM